MAIPWVVSMNIASEKLCFPMLQSGRRFNPRFNVFLCVIQESVPIYSKMGEMGKAWRAEVSIRRGVGKDTVYDITGVLCIVCHSDICQKRVQCPVPWR